MKTLIKIMKTNAKAGNKRLTDDYLDGLSFDELNCFTQPADREIFKYERKKLEE